MSSETRTPPPPPFAERARAAARAHGDGLRAVNEKLALLVSSLQEQRRRLADFAGPGPRGAPADPLPPPAGAPEGRPLAAELALAREALAQRAEEDARLRERLTEIREENRRLCDAHAAVQQQSADLASLFAALDRLHAAEGREEVLAVIAEIVREEVGAEALAVLVRSADGALAVVRSAGFSEADLAALAAGAGPVGWAARGEAFVRDPATPPATPGATELVAAVPLEAGGAVGGVLAIGRLLCHKRALVDLDLELFALLRRNAARALARTPSLPTGAPP